ASVPKQSAQIVGDDFLDQVETPYVKKSAPIVGDEFLNQIGESRTTAKQPPHVVSDDFLDQIGENRTTAKHSAQIVGDDFLDQVQAPQVKQVVKEAAPIVGDDFLDQIYSIQNNPMAAASVVGDDFLDQIHETSVKKTAPVVGDDFLDQITATQNKPMAKKPAPIVGDDFLEQVGRPTNDIVAVKNAKDSSSMPFGSAASKSSFVVPGQQPFKPVTIHKSSNIPFFKDDTLKKLIHSAEIGVNYDSESSESSASEKETINHKFAPLEYKIDQYLNVPNFAVVNDMKKQIAQSLPKPKLHHLLNFWLENFSGFPELVVFFQYLQYHIENFSLVDCLEFKKYRSLLNAVIRREPVFQSIEHLVANIPLMCKYKFLIYDDNYPDFIYVNPELLNLQMFPLASGLPSSVMYLFQRQRKWIISDLKKEFRDCSDTEFYRQLNNFLNDRPDLVMLESPKPKATLPQMSIVLNEEISVKLCCFMFSLKDLNVAEHLHLRMDYINSMKQFIPQRSKAR
uniref:Uncharacterized protein n=1 Tax=Panagrolaimus sp. ES5 TaxID=591445 RepID=A0AC34FIY4_9BILA